GDEVLNCVVSHFLVSLDGFDVMKRRERIRIHDRKGQSRGRSLRQVRSDVAEVRPRCGIWPQKSCALDVCLVRRQEWVKRPTGKTSGRLAIDRRRQEE